MMPFRVNRWGEAARFGLEAHRLPCRLPSGGRVAAPPPGRQRLPMLDGAASHPLFRPASCVSNDGQCRPATAPPPTPPQGVHP